MKSNFLLAAALVLGTAAAASAQTTPTGTPRTGTMNQTTPMVPNPASPTLNPGTLEQRTPVSPQSQMRTNVGTMDATPSMQSQTTIDAERRPATMTTTEPTRMQTTRPARKANAPRSTRPIK